MRGCVIYEQTDVCVNVIEYTSLDDLVLGEDYYLAPDNTGEIGWTWTGTGWRTPQDFWTNVTLYGTTRAPTPDFGADDERIANTFWVNQRLTSYLADESFTIHGGSFGDVDVVTYNAGRFDGAGSNLTGDLISPIFNGTGGNLTSDIDGGAFV